MMYLRVTGSLMQSTAIDFLLPRAIALPAFFRDGVSTYRFVFFA